MCSRGSVIPLWIEQMKLGCPITITDPNMTRFIMSLDEAVDLVLFAFENGVSGDILVQKAPACTIGILAQAVKELFQSQDEIKMIGIRHGEKMYETLLTNEECAHAEDLGAFYLDILKDRLYTTGKDSLARRSAQTALYYITMTLVKLMAPILSFTCEEAWTEMRRTFLSNTELKDGLTIFTELYQELPQTDGSTDLLAKWNRILEIRAQLNKELEDVRSAGDIGSALQAEVDVYAGGQDYKFLKSLNDDLKFVFIVSRATLHEDAAATEVRFEIAASEHDKCERCWHYREDVNQDPEHPGICGRCVDNLYGDGEDRHYA